MAGKKKAQARYALTVAKTVAFVFLLAGREGVLGHDGYLLRPRATVHWNMIVGDPWLWPHPYHPWPTPIIVPVSPIIVAPPVYLERPRPSSPDATRAAGYWYYCVSQGGYYPQVTHCAEEWVPVPPRYSENEGER